MAIHKHKRYISKAHRDFFADIAEVMEKHHAISGSFLLAEVKDKDNLILAGDVQNCIAWATDPRTHEVYCIKHGGE